MFIALLHDDKTECSYSGYERQPKAPKMEFPPVSEFFAPITKIAFCKEKTGDLGRVFPLASPLRYSGKGDDGKMYVYLELDEKLNGFEG